MLLPHTSASCVLVRYVIRISTVTHHVDHKGAGGLPLELPIRVAGTQIEEACAALVRDGVRQQRFAAALGSIQQH